MLYLTQFEFKHFLHMNMDTISGHSLNNKLMIKFGIFSGDFRETNLKKETH